MNYEGRIIKLVRRLVYSGLCLLAFFSYFILHNSSFAASPVNVSITRDSVNVTVEQDTPAIVTVAQDEAPTVTVQQEDTATVTVSTPVGEILNVVTAGEQGIPGAAGAAGAPGVGVPTGGSVGQVLTKTGPADYSTAWQDASGGVSSWNDLTDKPATFPPSAHYQNISTINGLEAALSAKANSANLASVATSGSYNDLTDKPVIPAAGVGQDHFNDYSAARQAEIESKQSAAGFTGYTTVARVAYSDSLEMMQGHGGAMAMIAAHPGSIVPHGGHPAAGADRQMTVNVKGTPAGAAMSRYSDSRAINQATSRYSRVHEWHGPDNQLVAYLLGSGAMVWGQPTTTNFTITWSPVSGSTIQMPLEFLISAIPVGHSFDNTTVIKGSSVFFTNFTSFTPLQSGGTWMSRRAVPSGTNVRIRYTTAVKDLEGRALYQPYSANWTTP